MRQVQGDSEMSLIPPEQPEPRIVDDFFRELDDALRKYNHGRTDAARLRLRAALHYGVAYESAAGFAGDAPVTTARMLNSRELHRALEGTPGADLAVAVSDLVYRDIVLNRHCSLDPSDFERCDLEIKDKEF